MSIQEELEGKLDLLQSMVDKWRHQSGLINEKIDYHLDMIGAYNHQISDLEKEYADRLDAEVPGWREILQRGEVV